MAAARAIWKGIVTIGTLKVPVKLYSAVTERTVHFRLLHKTDLAPVKQQLFDAESGEAVESAAVKKAFPVSRGRVVVLEQEELESLEPKDSRDIEVSRFVDPSDMDPRFYDRSYYLGPDSDSASYFAAVEALQKKKKEGIAQWTMRKKSYIGALRAEGDYLILITLRHAEEIISADALQAPSGRPLQAREMAMAGQLLEALAGTFDPNEYRDEYRARVMDLVETKAKGRKPKVTKFRAKKTTDEDALTGALAASLKGLKKASGG